MKNIAFLLFLSLCFSQITAQERFVSLEGSFSLPTGEFAEGFSYGVGANASYTYGINKRYAAVGLFGVNFFQTKDDGVFENEPQAFYYQIPIEVGIRYFPFEIKNGPYAGLLTGINFQDVFIGNQSEPVDEKDGYYSLTPEAGWFLSRNISVALRYRFTFIPERFEEESIVVEGPDGRNTLETRDVKRDEEILSYLSLQVAYNF